MSTNEIIQAFVLDGAEVSAGGDVRVEVLGNGTSSGIADPSKFGRHDGRPEVNV